MPAKRKTSKAKKPAKARPKVTPAKLKRDMRQRFERETAQLARDVAAMKPGPGKTESRKELAVHRKCLAIWKRTGRIPDIEAIRDRMTGVKPFSLRKKR